MTPEELIEKIKREYPIGTKFYPAHLYNNTKTCEVYDYINLIFDTNGDIDLYRQDKRNGHLYHGCLYRKEYDKWAEIVKVSLLYEIY